jgi:REP element-mobilizing transposase RayT
MANTFTNLLYHIVFSTKDRIPAIHGEMRERLYEYMAASSAGNAGSCWRSAGFPTTSTFW